MQISTSSGTVGKRIQRIANLPASGITDYSPPEGSHALCCRSCSRLNVQADCLAQAARPYTRVVSAELKQTWEQVR